MYFYEPFHFFKVPFNFACLSKEAFCKAKLHRGTPKEEKCQFVIFLIKWHFFMPFYLPFLFFKLLFEFACLSKAAFCKDKAHRGTAKGEKMSLLFSVFERHFFMYFYVPFHVFKVPFDFACLPKAPFCKSKAHRGTPKGGTMSVLFFSNRTAFFHAFLQAILLFQGPFRFFRSSKTSILQG